MLSHKSDCSGRVLGEERTTIAVVVVTVVMKELTMVVVAVRVANTHTCVHSPTHLLTHSFALTEYQGTPPLLLFNLVPQLRCIHSS